MLDETVYRNAATSHESRPAAQNLSRTVTVIVTALSQLVHYTRIYGGTLWNDHRSSGVSEAYSDTGRHPALRTGKSVGLRLQWFESTTCHPGQRLFLLRATGREQAGSAVGPQSSFSGSVESDRHGVQIVGEQVAVLVEREDRRLVAQQLLDDFDVRARRDRQRGAGVPQTV